MNSRAKIKAMPGAACQDAAAGDVGRLKTLYRLLATLSHATVPEEVYEAALTSLLEATAADRAAILLFDEDGLMRFHASRGLSSRYQAAMRGYSPWRCGERDAQPLVVPDVLADKSLAAYGDTLAHESIRALAFVPLALHEGVFGRLTLYCKDPYGFTGDELRIAQAIATGVSLATERKRTELARVDLKQLQAAGRLLAAIVETPNDAIVSKDLNGIITSWNATAERIFGYTPSEAIGKPVSMLADPERLDEMPRILAKIRRGERVEHYETRRRRKDGRIIDVALTISPVRDAAGKIVGASKIARDITDRKQAEEERVQLLARERAARRTAELLNRLGRKLVAQLDLQKLEQEVTDIATTLVGAEFGAFFHNTLNEQGEAYKVYTVSTVGREAFAGLPALFAGDLLAPVFRGEGTVRCADLTQLPEYLKVQPDGGQSREALPVRSYLAVPVVARSGEVLGGLLFGHSRAERFNEGHEGILTGIAAQAAIAMDNARLFERARWAQAELKRSNEELRRANRDLEVFAYSASHDLQEPLRTVAISAQLLERNCGRQLQGEAPIFLNNVITAANRMSALVEDLLAYTKATKQEAGPAPSVDSETVLAKSLEVMRGPMEEAGAVVTHGDLPRVAMHESPLAQLFQNLIGNAIKYRHEEPPRVEVTAVEQDGWSVFSVTDNGIGIEAEFAEQIFGLFKRLHSHNVYPGSGIGLAICRRVVEQYGGRIWLERSVPGKGSTFCFSVPASPE